MPQHIKVLMVGVAMLLLIVPVASLLVLLNGGRVEDILFIPMVLTMAVFMAAELPEDADA